MKKESRDELLKGAFLALAGAPWLLIGYSLIQSTKPAGTYRGFSGYITNRTGQEQ